MAKKKRSESPRDEMDLLAFDALPDRRAIEKVMQQFVSNYLGEQHAETPLDRAQEIIYEAFEASPSKQASLAKKALKISPDCADAHVLLAEHAETNDEALEHYRQGVAAGERAIGPKAFRANAGHFWGVLETRPYMRARQGLAECLWQGGHREEAAEHYRAMLELNPNDNQGVRYSLASLLMELGHEDQLRKLFADYKDDASAEWFYGSALLAFKEGGDCKSANDLLKRAKKDNKHVPVYLLGHKALPAEPPSYITRGGEDEAINYVGGNRRIWLDTPGAISWVRKTLDLPLPKGQKRQRPAWPELRLALQRIPQEVGETWQIDVFPFQVSGQDDSKSDAPWVIMIVGRASQEILLLEILESAPKSVEIWEYVLDAMRRPLDLEPHRPASIEVRQKKFQTAWKAKLQQIGVACIHSDVLDALDLLRERLPTANLGQITAGQNIEVEPEEILALPLESGEVWQADLRALPTWVTGEGVPYRPWMALVSNRTDDIMLAHHITPERPSIDNLRSVIVQAMRQPVVGEPHRPSAIEFGSLESRNALQPFLDQIGVEGVVLDRLENLDSAVDGIMRHYNGPGGASGIMDAPGITTEQMSCFYAAAAEYYRRKPWRRVPGDAIIKVECDKFKSGPWYAVVMGQSGIEQGLAIYEDLPALRRMITGRALEAENARGMSALSLMYSEAFDISPFDLDAIEKHGWPVAGPEAYPLVLRVNPGPSLRAPLVWELDLLECCLRTIPAFLEEKPSADAPGESASNSLPLRLSWVS